MAPFLEIDLRTFPLKLGVPIGMVFAGGWGKSDTARAMGRSRQSAERAEGAGRGDPKESHIFATSNGVFFK